ncbi:MAG: hypothetical protein J6W76_06555 [Spirochaetales bacterium]|nr:hypothetical protein [Spirochaetales bacterium]
MYSYQSKLSFGFAAVGLIGGIMLSTADWLLGAVSGASVSGNMFFSENCVAIPYWRLSVSMIFAVFGTVFFLWGLFLQKDLYREDNVIMKNIYAFFCIAGGTTWLFIHFLYAVYRACMKLFLENTVSTGLIEAVIFTDKLSSIFMPVSIIAANLMIIPHLIFMISLIMKKTVLPRWFVIFYIIIFSIIFGIVCSLTKGTAFSNGLSMASSNMALTLWFVVVVIFRNKIINYK